MTTQTESLPGLPGLHFVPEPLDAAWALDRDRRLAAFITARMQLVETTSCSDERTALFWILNVLPIWLAALTRDTHDASTAPCLETVGWILRQVAHSKWSRHPQWEPDFHPQAVAPLDSGEARA